MTADCVTLRAMVKVPAEQLQAYIQCMEAPSAGPPMETVTAAQGVFASAVVIALAISQLVGANNRVWRRILLGVIAAGFAGLAYSALNL